MEKLEIEVVDTYSVEGTNIQKWLRTIPIFVTYAAMGMCCSLVGTTYVHLELLFDVSSESVSQVLSILSMGYLGGALVCGFVYDRLPNPEVAFLVANLMASVVTVVAGVMKNFVLFTVFLAFQGIAFGYNDAAGQTYCMNIWNGKNLQKPVLQASHAFWSIGGILGPLIINLFLIEVSDISNESQHNTSDSEIIYRKINESLSESEYIKIEKTRFAYVTFGVITLFSAISFFALFCYRIKKTKKVSDNKIVKLIEKSEVSSSSLPRFKYIFFAAMVTFACILNLYIEGLSICFLVFFSLKHLKWSVLNSSRLLSCYFTSHFIGRLVAVVISAWFKPGTMLAFNLSITLAAYILMMFLDYWQYITWFTVILAGFGVSTTFPTSVLWVSEYIKMDGKLGSLLIVGSSIGTVTGPYLMSFVISKYGPFAFVYFLLITSFLHCILFVLQCIYAHWALKRQHIS